MYIDMWGKTSKIKIKNYVASRYILEVCCNNGLRAKDRCLPTSWHMRCHLNPKAHNCILAKHTIVYQINYFLFRSH